MANFFEEAQKQKQPASNFFNEAQNAPAEPIDLSIGASTQARRFVGSAPPAAKLRVLRKFYPDAVGGIDPATGEFSASFHDPKTGKLTVYRPKGGGLRGVAGDVASLSGEAAQAVGGTLGALAGGAVGGLPGAFIGGGLGAAGAQELETASVMGRAGVPDPRTTGERITDASIIAAINTAAPVVGAAAGAGGRAALRSLFAGREAARVAVRQSLRDAAQFGGVPTVAQATNRRALDSIEQFIAQTPGGARVVSSRAKEAAETAGASLQAKGAALAGGATRPELAGAIIIEGVEKGYIPRARAISNNLYALVDRAIPPATPVKVARTQAAFDELTRLIRGAENLSAGTVNPEIAAISSRLQSDLANSATGELPYEALARIRTDIGDHLSDRSLSSSVPRRQWSKLYAALSEDMEAAAEAQGPGALKAFKLATRYHRANAARVGEILDPLLGKNVPERVFKAVESASRDTPTVLRALKGSVTPEQWDVVSGAVMARLGRPAGQRSSGEAQFSFKTFLDNWRSMDSGSKDALFGRSGGSREELDALSRWAKRMEESNPSFFDPSGAPRGFGMAQTATYLAPGAAAGMAFGASSEGAIALLSGLALSAIGANGTARLLTSKRFARFLADGVKIKPEGMGAHLGRLVGIAEEEDTETQAALMEFVGNLKSIIPASTMPKPDVMRGARAFATPAPRL